jgi:hypothetical protein
MPIIRLTNQHIGYQPAIIIPFTALVNKCRMAVLWLITTFNRLVDQPSNPGAERTFISPRILSISFSSLRRTSGYQERGLMSERESSERPENEDEVDERNIDGEQYDDDDDDTKGGVVCYY